MDDVFVPLATLLRASAAASAHDEPPPNSGSVPRAQAAEPAAQVSSYGPASDDELSRSRALVVEDLALLRLAALEAFDRARVRLLELLARDVLARELMLAPADLDALAARALRSFAESEPLVLRIAPADAERVSAPLPVRIDPALSVGDLVLEVRDGEIDARFALRIRGAVSAAAGA